MQFRFLKGPIFANMILADEINRTPPKTQAAMLEAMQERKVTVGGDGPPLPDPFFVLATQNPIEQEGTYPLPEAQLDRFMFMISVDYPSDAEELQIMKMATGVSMGKPAAVSDRAGDSEPAADRPAHAGGRPRLCVCGKAGARHAAEIARRRWTFARNG